MYNKPSHIFKVTHLPIYKMGAFFGHAQPGLQPSQSGWGFSHVRTQLHERYLSWTPLRAANNNTCTMWNV